MAGVGRRALARRQGLTAGLIARLQGELSRARAAAEGAEQARQDEAVRRRTRELTDLAQHMQGAREDERARLARDLHDELGALLTSAKLDAARIRSRLNAAPPACAEALDRLAHLVRHLDGVIALKRRITEDLRPSALGHLGLVVTLEILARDFADASGLPVHCTLAAVTLGASAELVVYRVVQEALNNIAKHAGASQVWLSLIERDGRVRVRLRDDGCGLPPDLASRAAHGLTGMRFRVEAEHGVLTLTSAPGQGCTLGVDLPCARALR
jgi:signal transduction histidine kinase